MSRRPYDSTRRQLEDRFPHKADVLVPPEGMGQRLNAMHDWCDEHASKAVNTQNDKAGNWGASSFIDPHPADRSRPQDWCVFYFAERAVAERFAETWAAAGLTIRLTVTLTGKARFRGYHSKASVDYAA